MINRHNALDYFLLLVLAVMWSASFMLIKIGVQTIAPVTFTSIRLLLAAVILAAYVVVTRQQLPLHRRALLLYCVVGVFGNSLPFVLISAGEVRVSSSTAAILMGVMPIITFVLAHFYIPSEPLSLRKLFGVALGFAGLLTLVGASAFGGAADNAVGQLMVLGGAGCYAITVVFVRSQPQFSGVQMATGALVVAALTGVVAAFLFEQPFALSPSLESLYATILLAIFPTAIAALIYFRAIHRLGATTFSQINYLIPVLGGGWGVLLLGETLHWRMLAALALVLAGIYFVQARSKVTQRAATLK